MRALIATACHCRDNSKCLIVAAFGRRNNIAAIAHISNLFGTIS